MLKKILSLSVLTICLFLIPLMSQAKNEFIIENPVFLKVNIHYQFNGKDSKASYANYVNPGEGHEILAVNAQVQVKKWKRGFIFVDTKNNTEIFFEYQERRMQMSVDEYLSKITSATKINLGKMSKKDQKGINEGKASVGMSKDGVMMALGYPAAHKTPSPESNRWTYWQNRFRTLVVSFDDKGIVSNIRG